jgi:hypothetical protein
MLDQFVPMDAPLGLLGTAMAAGISSFGDELGIAVPKLDFAKDVTGREAIGAGTEVLGKRFPNLRESTTA